MQRRTGSSFHQRVWAICERTTPVVSREDSDLKRTPPVEQVCLLRRLVGGRIDAIGLSVVMPEGPRRIPGQLSVAPAPPAVRRLSGSYISSASAFGFWLARVSRPGAMFVARALRPRDGVVILANAGLGSRRRFGKGREFDNVSHYLPGDNAEDIH